MRLVLIAGLTVACGEPDAATPELLTCSPIDLAALAPYAGCTAVIDVDEPLGGTATEVEVYGEHGELLRRVSRRDGEVVAQSEFSYDTHLQRVAEEAEGGVSTTWTYDALGLLTERVIMSPGHVEVLTTVASDTPCAIAESTSTLDDRVNEVRTWTFDERGRPLHTSVKTTAFAEDGYATEDFTYPDETVSERIVSMWSDPEASGEPTRSLDVREHDADGRLLTETHFLGTEPIPANRQSSDRYEYDENGDPTLFERTRVDWMDGTESVTDTLETAWEARRPARTTVRKFGDRIAGRSWQWTCPETGERP